VSGARRVVRGGIAAVAAILVAAAAVSAATNPRAANIPTAAADPTPDQTGRIAFAGTAHRSLGEVANPVPGQPEGSTPVFGGGPTHFDDQPAARGDLMVFTSLRDGPTPQVYLREATGAVRRLTTGRDAAHPQLSQDRTLVAFDSAEPAPGGSQRVLWLVRTDGTGLRRLTDTAADETSPTFSPDGSRIAYSSTAAGRPQIFVRPVAGGPATQLTAEPTGAAIQPAWNPVNDPAHRDQIAYVLDADGNTDTRQDESVRLRLSSDAQVGKPVLSGTQADWQSRSPAWQPDGNGLLFVSDNRAAQGSDAQYGATTFAQVYVIPCRCAGEQASLLLAENRDVDSPTWLVDAEGARLVVARTTEASPNVASLQDIHTDGSDPRDLGTVVLTEDPKAATDSNKLFNPDPRPGPGPHTDPWTIRQSYSPDGRRLAVSRFEHNGDVTSERIWLSNPDGSGAHVLPIADRKPGDWETDVEWSPDSSMIALARRSPGKINRQGGPSRIIIVKVDTGQVVATLPPDPTADQDDDQPSWSPDGKLLAFSRGTVAGGPDGQPRDQHIWITSLSALGQQRDLTAAVCAPGCRVTDDSPVFAPDGRSLVFNRENDGLLQITLADTACRVLLPAGQNSCAGPVTAPTGPTGPYQPRDVAWSPDGKRMVLTTRRAADPNSPEMLALFDPATGALTPLGQAMPGRQKEPTWESTAHLTLTAPPTTPQVQVGSGTQVTATVTDQGPAPTGASVTVAVPTGLRLDGLTPSQGTCDPGRLMCDLGVLAPGGTATVTATMTGLVTGNQQIDWSVAGVVLDTAPGANAAQTVVPVVAPGAPPLPPPQPPAVTQPGVSVVTHPNPAYVGGRTTVRYTATNRGDATAAGPTLTLGLPAGVPVAVLPAGCTPTDCTLPDLVPGATAIVQVVLAPTAPGTATITTTLTTGNAGPTSASTTLRVLQPKIVAVPPIGKPGFVTSVRGTDFPPGVPVTLTWTPGITAAAVPTLPGADGRFIAQLLILPKDQTGPRTITASGAGFAPVTTPFLVVPGTIGPPSMVTRH
jgi:Tol biopolymer transport system component